MNLAELIIWVFAFVFSTTLAAGGYRFFGFLGLIAGGFLGLLLGVLIALVGLKISYSTFAKRRKQKLRRDDQTRE